jgi:hypothetical protein
MIHGYWWKLAYRTAVSKFIAKYCEQDPDYTERVETEVQLEGRAILFKALLNLAEENLATSVPSESFSERRKYGVTLRRAIWANILNSLDPALILTMQDKEAAMINTAYNEHLPAFNAKTAALKQYESLTTEFSFIERKLQNLVHKD